eukprot:3647494-Prymnesium_polylepis.1
MFESCLSLRRHPSTSCTPRPALSAPSRRSTGTPPPPAPSSRPSGPCSASTSLASSPRRPAPRSSRHSSCGPTSCSRSSSSSTCSSPCSMTPTARYDTGARTHTATAQRTPPPHERAPPRHSVHRPTTAYDALMSIPCAPMASGPPSILWPLPAGCPSPAPAPSIDHRAFGRGVEDEPRLPDPGLHRALPRAAAAQRAVPHGRVSLLAQQEDGPRHRLEPAAAPLALLGRPVPRRWPHYAAWPIALDALVDALP